MMFVPLLSILQMRKLKNTEYGLICKNLCCIWTPICSDSETHALITKFYYLPQQILQYVPSFVGSKGFK